MKRPLVFTAGMLIAVILLLACFDLPLSAAEAKAVPLSDEETREGELCGTLERISYTASGSVSLEIGDSSFSEGSGALSFSAGQVLAYASEEPDAPLGSLVCVRGKISLFPEPDNPGEFDQRAYARARNLSLRMTASQVRVSEEKNARPVREAARRFRSWLRSGLDRIFDEEDAAVLSALLLGDRSRLSDEVTDLYEAAGVRHVLTVSGLHVTLAAGAFTLAFGWGLSFLPWQRLPGLWGRRGYLIGRSLAAGLAVCFYTETAGCGLPLRRAAVMVLLLLLAQAAGQSYDLPSALSFALILAVLPCPYVLFEASFQMSFACVLVIGCVFPPVVRLLCAQTPVLKALLAPALLQLFIIPLQLWHYCVFHPLGAFANLLVVPLMTWILLFSFAAAALAHLFLPAAALAAGPAHVALRIIMILCGLIRKLPFSTVVTGRPRLWQLPLYAALAALTLFLLIRRRQAAAKSALSLIQTAGVGTVRRLIRESRRLVLLLIVLQWALAALFLLRLPDRRLSITSLCVGQGDCHVIRAGAKAFLIDGGSAYVSPARSKIIPYLKYEGIRRLYFVMASHADEDHINGLAELIEADGIRVDELILSGRDRGGEKTAGLEEAARSCGTAVRSVFEGDILTVGELTFRILSPPIGESEEENDSSLVLLLSRKNFRGLFAGDIGAETENAILKRYPGLIEDLDYLKVAHHGSKNSSSEAFASKTSPTFAVISCGRNNRYGHPHTETLERFAAVNSTVLRTDRCGAVRITADDGGKITAQIYKRKETYENIQDSIHTAAGGAGFLRCLRQEE